LASCILCSSTVLVTKVDEEMILNAGLPLLDDKSVFIPTYCFSCRLLSGVAPMNFLVPMDMIRCWSVYSSLCSHLSVDSCIKTTLDSYMGAYVISNGDCFLDMADDTIVSVNVGRKMKLQAYVEGSFFASR